MEASTYILCNFRHVVLQVRTHPPLLCVRTDEKRGPADGTWVNIGLCTYAMRQLPHGALRFHAHLRAAPVRVQGCGVCVTLIV